MPKDSASNSLLEGQNGGTPSTKQFENTKTSRDENIIKIESHGAPYLDRLEILNFLYLLNEIDKECYIFQVMELNQEYKVDFSSLKNSIELNRSKVKNFVGTEATIYQSPMGDKFEEENKELFHKFASSSKDRYPQDVFEKNLKALREKKDKPIMKRRAIS